MAKYMTIEVIESEEVTYQRALEKMVPNYKRWDKASDMYDEVSRKYPNNQHRIERAYNREDRAYNILRAQTRLIGELFVKDEDEVWEDVENLSFRNGGGRVAMTKDGKLSTLADRIDAEMVKLPVDADGEIIHVGDMMERGKTRGRVIALMLSNYPKKWGGGLHWGVQLEGEQAPTALDAFFHHYHAPTVEDVLREFAEKVIDSQIPSVHPTYEEAITEYAAKLRLAAKED